MFRDPVLRRSVEEEERFPRDRMPTKPGEPPAYHRPPSPTTQTPFSTGPSHTSPTTPAPPPLHHPNFSPHHHHRAPAEPPTTELPPLSTALFGANNTAPKYYDPTSDHGDRGLAQPQTRYESHYPSQVHPRFLFLSQTHPFVHTGVSS